MLTTSLMKPRQGRQNIAHGVSRGTKDTPSLPCPLPRSGGGGGERGWGLCYPRAHALGYILSTLRAWDAVVAARQATSR